MEGDAGCDELSCTSGCDGRTASTDESVSAQRQQDVGCLLDRLSINASAQQVAV